MVEDWQSRPTWQLALATAEELTASDPSAPFSRAELVAGIRRRDPTRREGSLGPVIQGMTEGLSGGPPSACGVVFRKVARGRYVLLPPDERLTSKAMAKPPATSGSTTSTKVEGRLAGLRAYFDTYVEWYDATVPFVRKGQYELHRETIDRRYALGSVEAAVQSSEFLQLLYRTLRAWGIGVRGSRLHRFGEFSANLRDAAPELRNVEHFRIEDPGLDLDELTGALAEVFDRIDIVDNKATIVPVSKTLHHLLPDLVPPMDRAWTGLFFAWSASAPQRDSRRLFLEAFSFLATVARATNPSRLVGAGWRTSPAKILDNALIGYCKAHNLQ